MNRIIAVSLVCMLTTLGVGACVSAPVNNVQADAATVRITLPRCVLDADADSAKCNVRIFDGAATADAQRLADGGWVLDVPNDTVTGPRVAFYSAPGYEPQVHALKMAASEHDKVVLTPKTDPRGGYLVGVVFRKSEAKVDGSACGIESFLAGKTVIVNRVRARFVAQTDNIGSFSLALPAGRYQVHVDETHKQIDVPQDDTVFVAMPLN